MTDILATIDAAVDGRCACGCGKQLEPDGPSMWFATPECQERWSDRQATNPHDVYDSPDAADVWSGYDHARVPLAGQRARQLGRQSENSSPEPPTGAVFARLGTPTHLSINGVDVSDYFAPGSRITAESVQSTAGTRLTMADLRRAFERIYQPPPERQVIASPAVAERIRVAGYDIDVVVSEMVPEGEVYLFNRPSIEFAGFTADPAADYLRNNLLTMRAQARVLFQGVSQALQPLADGLNAWRAVIFGELHRGNAARLRRVPRGYTPPRDNPRITALRAAYRQRQLARRRRRR